MQFVVVQFLFVFCRRYFVELSNVAVCPQPIKNIVTTTSFARTCESRITSIMLNIQSRKIMMFSDKLTLIFLEQ